MTLFSNKTDIRFPLESDIPVINIVGVDNGETSLSPLQAHLAVHVDTLMYAWSTLAIGIFVYLCITFVIYPLFKKNTIF